MTADTAQHLTTLEPGPIPVENLPASLQRTCGLDAPAQVRMMAARGLAPMGPQDLAIALFQLSHDRDEPIAEAARKTAAALPERVLLAALPSPLDARVLDFFGRIVYSKPNLVELVILNPETTDDTFLFLSAHCAERELELIAANEQRILRRPAIIEVLYYNRAARMSTVDRLIELAVRHGIQCEGIPAFEDAARAIQEQGPPLYDGAEFEIDAQFEQAVEADEQLQGAARKRAGSSDDEKIVKEIEHLVAPKPEEGQPPEEIQQRKRRIEDLPLSAKIRLATVGNASARAILVRDSNKVVAMAAVNSPALSDIEAVSISQNRALIADVIVAIARNKSFVKNYQVKLGLTFNPKCPFAIALKLLPHLHDADVKVLAKSKNVPQQVATAARRLCDTREQKR